MAVTINASTSAGLVNTADTSGVLALQTAGTTALTVNGSQNVGIGTASPNSRMSVAVSSTNTSVLGSYANIPLLLQNTSSTDNNWSVIAVQDASGDFSSYIGTQNTSQSSSTAIMAFATNSGSGATERMRIDSSGNVGINTASPTQYATSGKVLNITGTANNSGPAVQVMSGSSANPGAGNYIREVFALAGIAGTATEITRITGTGANGMSMYIRVTVNGHTAGVGNGSNYKGVRYDGGTSAVTQVETATSGSVPTITFDTAISNVLVIQLAAAGVGGLNGVMVIEWFVPIDFASSTWVVS